MQQPKKYRKHKGRRRIFIAVELQQTFPKRSSSLLSETTRGAANRPQGNTSTVAPVTVFMITYSRLIPKHSDSPHHAMDFTTSRTGSSFTSVKSLLPEKMAPRVLKKKFRKRDNKTHCLLLHNFGYNLDTQQTAAATAGRIFPNKPNKKHFTPATTAAVRFLHL
jgi:hypothetical protein